jgi:peptide/nickel transport system ATP-binding protein
MTDRFASLESFPSKGIGSLLSVRHLSADFVAPGGSKAHALEDVSLEVYPGQTLGLVGESGCGKTTLLLTVMRLLPASGRITQGEVFFEDTDLLSLSELEMRRYRWKEMAIVFQGAMNALNPVLRVGDQIREAITLHLPLEGKALDRRVDQLLEMVGIARARRSQYPHEYSGGMRQRAMIAMALACSPKLLFADEPTTALDVMIQAQVLELLRELQKELELAIILVTHDLGVVAEVCDSILVMYGGKVAEYGSSDRVYNFPQHPYTQRLLEAFPDLNKPEGDLISIPGSPPRLSDLPAGCRFEPRCHERVEICRTVPPKLIDVSRSVAPGSSRPGAVGQDLSVRLAKNPTPDELVFLKTAADPRVPVHRAACHLCRGEELDS